MAINASAELSVLQAVAQFLTYAVMAVFAENAVFFRALGVSRLNKLVNDPKISTWQYCIPIILVQLPGATFNCCVLGTLLVAASQNYNLLQSIGFGFGSGVGYLVAVLVVDEGRRRLRSKDIPHIFRGLPSVLIYIGILSLAIYGLVGTVD